MQLLKVFRNLEKIGGHVDWTDSAIVQLLQHLPPHAQDPSLSHSEDGFTPMHTPPPRTLAPKKDRWHEDRRVLLLSEVSFWTESGDPIAPRSPTETEFAQLPLALVLPDYGQHTYLFLYRNGLRLRIDFRELDSFSWWFDDIKPSILVFKIGGKKFAADAVDGEQAGDPRPPADWIFWEKFVLERQDSAVECFQNHLITVRARAHSEAGARAVGEFGRLLDKNRFGRKDGDRTPSYKEFQSFVETDFDASDRIQKRDRSPLDSSSEPTKFRPPPPQAVEESLITVGIGPKPSTAHSWNRRGPPIESFPKRYHRNSPPQRQRSRSQSPPRMDMWKQNRSSDRHPYIRSRSPDKPRPRVDTYRPEDKSSDRRSTTRSRSPEKPRPRNWDADRQGWTSNKRTPIDPRPARSHEPGNPQPDMYTDNVERSMQFPERRAPAGPVTERDKPKDWADMTDQQKERWIDEGLAKPKRS
jgi:hypothetical protein